jgi:hypothetical protein
MEEWRYDQLTAVLKCCVSCQHEAHDLADVCCPSIGQKDECLLQFIGASAFCLVGCVHRCADAVFAAQSLLRVMHHLCLARMLLLTCPMQPQARLEVPGPGTYTISETSSGLAYSMGSEAQRPVPADEIWRTQVVRIAHLHVDVHYICSCASTYCEPILAPCCCNIPSLRGAF